MQSQLYPDVPCVYSGNSALQSLMQSQPCECDVKEGCSRGGRQTTFSPSTAEAGSKWRNLRQTDEDRWRRSETSQQKDEENKWSSQKVERACRTAPSDGSAGRGRRRTRSSRSISEETEELDAKKATSDYGVDTNVLQTLRKDAQVQRIQRIEDRLLQTVEHRMQAIVQDFTQKLEEVKVLAGNGVGSNASAMFRNDTQEAEDRMEGAVNQLTTGLQAMQ